MAESVAQSQGRLRWMADTDLTRPLWAVRELRRAVEELGFVARASCPGCGGFHPPTG